MRPVGGFRPLRDAAAEEQRRERAHAGLLEAMAPRDQAEVDEAARLEVKRPTQLAQVVREADARLDRPGGEERRERGAVLGALQLEEVHRARGRDLRERRR